MKHYSDKVLICLPYSIYDSYCGGGYLLASDIDHDPVKLCIKNLKLLSYDGLGERIAELENSNHNGNPYH